MLLPGWSRFRRLLAFSPHFGSFDPKTQLLLAGNLAGKREGGSLSTWLCKGLLVSIFDNHVVYRG